MLSFYCSISLIFCSNSLHWLTLFASYSVNSSLVLCISTNFLTLSWPVSTFSAISLWALSNFSFRVFSASSSFYICYLDSSNFRESFEYKSFYSVNYWLRSSISDSAFLSSSLEESNSVYLELLSFCESSSSLYFVAT